MIFALEWTIKISFAHIISENDVSDRQFFFRALSDFTEEFSSYFTFYL